MTDAQAEKMINILTDINENVKKSAKEAEDLKNLFLKYDLELLLEQEDIRED